MDILKKAITQALTLLSSCGARYHIIEADGTEHGTPIVQGKKRIHRPRDPNAPRYMDLIREKITPMQIGDVVVLRPQGEDKPQRLQSHIGAWCSKQFGPGCFMTTVNDGAVEVLRIK